MKRPTINQTTRHGAQIFAATLLSLALFACADDKPASALALEPTGRIEYDALLALFKKQVTTPEVKSYGARGTKRTSSNLMEAVLSCTKVAPDAEWPQMTIILKIDAHGVVQDARANADSPLAGCVEGEWRGKLFELPPFSPFYQMVTLDAHSGGERPGT